MNPTQPSRFATRCDARLRAFDPSDAETVSGWITTRDEAYLVAPRTPPPVTAAAIRTWRGPGHHQFILVDCHTAEAIGYGEVNMLNARRREYWLGHLIVTAAQRGRGYGVALTRRLLEFAFIRCNASAVSLVVFQNNERAIRSYRAAGMIDDGYEQHYFPAYGRQESLLRLRCTRWPG